MAWVPYDSFKTRQHNGNAIDFDNDTLKIALLTASYTPNRATHVFLDDVDANEVTGSNYTIGGVTLTGAALAIVSNTLHFDTDDASWTQHASGFSNARYAVFYKDTGSGATSPLVAYADLGGNVGNVNGDLTLPIVDIFTV